MEALEPSIWRVVIVARYPGHCLSSAPGHNTAATSDCWTAGQCTALQVTLLNCTVCNSLHCILPHCITLHNALYHTVYGMKLVNLYTVDQHAVVCSTVQHLAVYCTGKQLDKCIISTVAGNKTSWFCVVVTRLSQVLTICSTLSDYCYSYLDRWAHVSYITWHIIVLKYICKLTHLNDLAWKKLAFD